MLRFIKERHTKKLLCNCCPRPFAVMRNGLVIIESRHAGDMHPNGLTSAELRELANELDNCGKLPQDNVAG
jgi:hypothetical protein